MTSVLSPLATCTVFPNDTFIYDSTPPYINTNPSIKTTTLALGFEATRIVSCVFIAHTCCLFFNSFQIDKVIWQPSFHTVLGSSTCFLSPFFLLYAAILVYPYLQLKYSHIIGWYDLDWRRRMAKSIYINKINTCWFLSLVHRLYLSCFHTDTVRQTN